MTQHAFIITSAINTKFGVYSSEQRLSQTLETISSVRKYVPTAQIILMECAGMPLDDQQQEILDSVTDMIVDFTDDPDVQGIYASDNWDVVKSTTEIMCFRRTLQILTNDGDLEKLDRIHKLSGRYQLNQHFNPKVYDILVNNIIVSPKHRSQFPLSVTGIEMQYMSRLWSWPAKSTPTIIDVYDQGLAYIADRVAQGGYADIEHILFKFLPPTMVAELSPIGVEGMISPNGVAVND